MFPFRNRKSKPRGPCAVQVRDRFGNVIVTANTDRGWNPTSVYVDLDSRVPIYDLNTGERLNREPMK